MLKWSSTTVLLLLLLHKNTDYYRPDNLWIMWLARKKNKFVDGKEIYGKTLSKWDLQCCQISEFQKRPNSFGNGQIGRDLVVYWRSSHRRPPANVPRLGQPGLAPPIYLPPHFPQKNKTRKVYYFTKEKKKVCCCSLPFSHWFHPRLMAIVVT